MVVMQNKCGQLGNRLTIFSHFIAGAMEHGYRLYNPTFDEYCRYFPATRQDDFRPWPISVGGRGRLSAAAFERLTYFAGKVLPRSPWHAFIRWRGTVPAFDLGDPAFVALARTRTVLVFGWMFRDVPCLLRHAAEVRRFFTPDTEVMDRLRRLADDCRRDADVLVGVHIRRGDYRSAKHNRYCYEDAVYCAKMEQAAALLAGSNRRVRFLGCSNEPLDFANYPGLAITRGPGSALEDMYALAQCDCILGPPSTFSGWASFYGWKPLCWIEDPARPLTHEDFRLELRDPL